VAGKEQEHRLSKGARLHLGTVQDLFTSEMIPSLDGTDRKRRVYRQVDQKMIEPFDAALAHNVAGALEKDERRVEIGDQNAPGTPSEEAQGDRITLLDLSGLEEVDPAELVKGIRSGIRAARPESNARGGPLWTAGRRFAALRWRCESRRGRLLRASFVTAWELEDRRRPKERLPLPFLTEEGTSVLGDLPPRMGGARLQRLCTTPLLTYHALEDEPGAPGNSAKALGRELLRYQRLGLLIPREYPTAARLRDLGIPDHPTGRARPRLWESVPAAAHALFRG
jgi:hypothetical protein